MRPDAFTDPQRFATVCALTAFILALSSVPTSATTQYLVCREPKLDTCSIWITQVQEALALARVSNPGNDVTHLCGLSSLQTILAHRRYIMVSTLKDKSIKPLLCKFIIVKGIDLDDLLRHEKVQSIKKRVPRQAGYSLRGRYRGQTQSQYLAIDRGSGKDDGKAEAHSAADSSRASVSGSSGMGQAQSQTMYDPSCDDCLGRSESDAESLKRRPTDTLHREGPGGISQGARLPGGNNQYSPGGSGIYKTGQNGEPDANTIYSSNQVDTPDRNINSIFGNQQGSPGGSGIYKPDNGGSFNPSLDGLPRGTEKGIYSPINTFGTHHGTPLGGINYGVNSGNPGTPGTGIFTPVHDNGEKTFSPYQGAGHSGTGSFNPNLGSLPGVGNTGFNQDPPENIQRPFNSNQHGSPNTSNFDQSGLPGGTAPDLGAFGPNQPHLTGFPGLGNYANNQGGTPIGTPFGVNQHSVPSNGNLGSSFNPIPGIGGVYGTNHGAVPLGPAETKYVSKHPVLPGQINQEVFVPKEQRLPAGGSGQVGISPQGQPGPYGMNGVSNWPHGAGTFVGPDGTTYYCCIAGPNNSPQYYKTADGRPGTSLQTNIPYGSGSVIGQNGQPLFNEQYSGPQNLLAQGTPYDTSGGNYGTQVPSGSSTIQRGPTGQQNYGQTTGPYGVEPSEGYNLHTPGQDYAHKATAGPNTGSGGQTAGNIGGLHSPGFPTGKIDLTGPIGQYSPGATEGHRSVQVPGAQYAPGSTTGGQYTPGSTSEPHTIGSTGGQYAPGSTSGQYNPGSTGSQYTPGGIGSQYTPGGTGSQYIPGSHYTPGGTGNQYTPPGGQYTPGVRGNQFTPGSTGVQYGPVITGGPYSPGGAGRQIGPGGTSGQYSPESTSVQYGPSGTSGQYIPGGGFHSSQGPSGQYSPGSTSGQYGPNGIGGHNGLQESNGNYGQGSTTGQNSPLGNGQYSTGSKGAHNGIRGPTAQYDNGAPVNGLDSSKQYVPGTSTGPTSYISPDSSYGTGNTRLQNASPPGAIIPYGGNLQEPGSNGVQNSQYRPGKPIGYYPSQYSNGGATNQPGNGPYGFNNQANIGQSLEYPGVPQNVIDPNSATIDGDDSEAEASVSQAANGTIAIASSKGGNDKGRAQTHVHGAYTDSGSFSAQAEITGDNKAANSEVTGDQKGASSNAQGSGRNNKSQANVQLGSETGSVVTGSQSEGVMHSSNTQVQGSVKGGMADAQARGPGSTSSQAQIGFTPYKEGDKSHDSQKTPFVGGGTAGAQSSGRTGSTQSQLRGTFKYGITYNGAAQAGASLNKDTVFPNRLPFEKIDVYDENNKNINVNTEKPSDTISNSPPTPDYLPVPDNSALPLKPADPEQPLGNPTEISPSTDVPFETQSTTEKIKELESEYSNHVHADHHKTESQPATPTLVPPVESRRSFPSTYGSNGGDYEYTTDKDENPPEDYDVDDGFAPEVADTGEGEQGEYTNYNEFSRDREATHQSLQSPKRKGIEVRQTTGGSTQHIVLGSLSNQDAQITQKNSEHPDEGKVYQAGERVPGTGGYTIPVGFTGSVKSVASKENTFVVGSKDSPSQAQTVSLTPGTGKIKYTYPPTYGRNIHPKNLRSLDHSKSDDSNRYVSVSKSVTRDLDSEDNIRKQYSHTYYTKSSSCGYFSFTCTIVTGAEGKRKVCKPKIPTNPDGTLMRC